jgi:hypothetical protein
MRSPDGQPADFESGAVDDPVKKCLLRRDLAVPPLN